MLMGCTRQIGAPRPTRPMMPEARRLFARLSVWVTLKLSTRSDTLVVPTVDADGLYTSDRSATPHTADDAGGTALVRQVERLGDVETQHPIRHIGGADGGC